MNFEVIDNLFQAIVLSFSSAAAVALAVRMQERRFLLLAFAYICFAMGTIYWLLHIVIMGMVPQVFYVAEISWGLRICFICHCRFFVQKK